MKAIVYRYNNNNGTPGTFSHWPFNCASTVCASPLPTIALPYNPSGPYITLHTIATLQYPYISTNTLRAPYTVHSTKDYLSMYCTYSQLCL